MKYLSIDAGGTSIKYAWLDEKGNILKQGKTATPRTCKEDFLVVVRKIWDQEPAVKGGICLSLPGTIDSKTGYIYQGGSLTYHRQFNIKEYYQQEFQTKVEVENDARCATIAELTTGNLQGIKNGIVLTFGTGVGGSIVINGELYKGTNLISGEVSMLICKDLRKLGSKAILGNMAGIPGFVERVSKAKGIEASDGETVFEWIKQGDKVACELFEEYCYDVMIQLINLQLIIDPQRVCIGGGVSANPVYIAGIKKALEKFYDSLPYAIPRLDVVPCKYGNDANILGAFYHFKQCQK